jgi:hypothetical protein
MSIPELLENAIDEVIDLGVYLLTLRNAIAKENGVDRV